jgi:hypothetical protein
MAAITFTAGSTLTAAQMNQIGQDSDWITVGTFTNSWVAGSRAPQYRKVGTRVTIIGIIQSGTAGNAAFTLPSAYRPTSNVVFPTCSNAGVSNTIQVGSDGKITPNGTSTTALDSISFYTD